MFISSVFSGAVDDASAAPQVVQNLVPSRRVAPHRVQWFTPVASSAVQETDPTIPILYHFRVSREPRHHIHPPVLLSRPHRSSQLRTRLDGSGLRKWPGYSAIKRSLGSVGSDRLRVAVSASVACVLDVIAIKRGLGSLVDRNNVKQPVSMRLHDLGGSTRTGIRRPLTADPAQPDEVAAPQAGTPGDGGMADGGAVSGRRWGTSLRRRFPSGR
jgi:hypothetical protein